MPIFFKNIKLGFPPKIKLFFKPKWERWDIKMTASHIVGDKEEQFDWMKIVGMAFTINARKESTMIGGRWNIEKQKWQFNVYSHLKGVDAPIYTKTLFEADIDEEFYVILGIDREDKKYHWLFYRDDEVAAKYSQAYNKGSKCIGREVSAWAGGTLPGQGTHWFKAKNRHL